MRVPWEASSGTATGMASCAHTPAGFTKGAAWRGLSFDQVMALALSGFIENVAYPRCQLFIREGL